MNNDPFANVDDAPSFKVVESVREAVPALVCLWGLSDAGKTYSALRLARGLVGPKGKIVVIDTENKRAKFYAGLFGGWSHIDMQPPFTPQRYTAALNAAIQAGANVVIVDSMSHVWQGQGGVLDQADASTAKGLAKWKAPKMAYMRMMNGMLRAPVHVIFCVRAKEKFVQKGSGKDAEIVSAGLVPITDSRFIYEQTVAVFMEGHRPSGAIKIPGEIAHAIAAGEYITEESGRLIAEWLAGGSPVDHTATALQASARDVATQGSVKFRDWWQSLTKAQKTSLKAIIPELKEIADQADEEAAKAAQQASETANSPGDTLDDPFTAGATKAAE